MANLKEIRDRIKSVKSIQQVTKAMKMVAAAKLRRAQQNMEQSRPYTENLENMISSLLPDVDRSMLALLDKRPVKRIAYLIISSDRGLAGSFNSNVIKKAQTEIDEFGKDNVDVFCIGKKVRDHFKKREYNIIEEHIGFWNELDFSHAIKIGSGVISKFLSGDVDEIKIVGNLFKNIAVQKTICKTLLPLTFDTVESVNIDRIFEPSKIELVEALIPRHLNVQVWQALLESYASEMAARMVSMENATTNADDMIKSLKLKFNKARQAAITKEILEIVSGAEALA
ncbi:MAG: ATP synthase F1 subunit gamma [Candidatus Marinimicrobia bacterium]|jgi:F-type H+-transporting ATPase subunit gamma|nr:ATP synthase F1 subunit gamma [Candidatus Neomarinimicrobiota bacterium]MBT3632753.1 ATP synthase F1 subunit gamma [Candidatus Neomarinimicrobiota bacterium]MBT3681863.1 ATP synthase F1 subunit gamma [Candidatus Neomarinimicrobiota bacterium]MBT3760504.1 ATP synthase F1 subunit gamma [Candidatus Neomarinimicrobiota bacterium]MBT3896650.1 ATP synthase F1 subunit gamma [Candidatus Neomarinimicrobiota bacterium]